MMVSCIMILLGLLLALGGLSAKAEKDDVDNFPGRYCIEGVVAEFYDVVALPGVRRPMALGFKTDEIRCVLSVES